MNQNLINTSVFDRKIKNVTLQLRIVSFSTPVIVAIALYLESYFTNHPTVEDLYYGKNNRSDNLWMICFPLLTGLIAYLFGLLFKLRSLKKKSTSAGPATRVEISVTNPSSTKTDQLERLAKLRADGAISDAEFNSLKKEVIQ